MTEQKNTPPPLRQAATVILVRPKDEAFEIYLLRRSTKSGFMGGLYVFPGGVVDSFDVDHESWAPHIDLTPDQIEARLGGTSFQGDNALSFAIAAIRETLEESGVFMASIPASIPADSQKRMDDICRSRLDHDLPKSWFKKRIMDEKWTLSLSSLRRWSHWITPELMKKRFDTRFFLAFMPENQTCVPDDMETKHGVWLTPQEALEQNLEKTTPLSPPAIVTLTQMLSFKTLLDLKKEMATRPWGEPIFPRLVPSSDGPIILEPWDPMHDTKDEIDTKDLSRKVLPAGSWFSRIWCDKGVWKPVDL